MKLFLILALAAALISGIVALLKSRGTLDAEWQATREAQVLGEAPSSVLTGYPEMNNDPRGFTEAEWLQIVNANHVWLQEKL